MADSNGLSPLEEKGANGNEHNYLDQQRAPASPQLPLRSAPQTSDTASMAGPSGPSPSSTTGRQRAKYPLHIFHRSTTSPARRWQLRHYLGSTIDVPFWPPIDADRIATLREQHNHIHNHDVTDGVCFVAFRCENCFCTVIDGQVIEMFVPARWVNPMDENPSPIPDDYAADVDYELALTPWYIEFLRDSDLLFDFWTTMEWRSKVHRELKITVRCLEEARETEQSREDEEARKKEKTGKRDEEEKTKKTDSVLEPESPAYALNDHEKDPTVGQLQTAAFIEPYTPLIVNGSTPVLDGQISRPRQSSSPLIVNGSASMICHCSSHSSPSASRR